MINLDKVLLGGRLTADPVFKHSKDNVALCQFCIAVNRKVKNGTLTKDLVSFITVDCLGTLAENIHKYFKKGKSIFIEGRLQQARWIDKATGQNRYKLQVIAESFQFVDEVKREDIKRDEVASTEAPQKSETEDPMELNTDMEKEPVDDELPF